MDADPTIAQYFLSSDVGLNVKLLVLNAHGSSPEMADADPPVSYTDCLSRKTQLSACDMFVSCQLHTHGRQQGVAERTCNTPGSRLRWNEWVSFRAKYSSLSPDAYITLCVCGSHGPRTARTVRSDTLLVPLRSHHSICPYEIRGCEARRDSQIMCAFRHWQAPRQLRGA